MSPAKRSTGGRKAAPKRAGRAPAISGGREAGGGRTTEGRRAASAARKAGKSPKQIEAAADKARGGKPPSAAERLRGGRPDGGRPGAAVPGKRVRTRSVVPTDAATVTGGRAFPSRSKGKSSTDRGLGGDQVEGRQAVREMLLAGKRKIYEVWVAADLDDAEVLDDIAELAQSVRVPVRDVSRTKLHAQARTEAPQGVLAKAAELPEADYDDLLTIPKKGPAPFLLALDGVTDPGNLGALLRTAEGAGVTGIVLPRHRAVHITPTVTKAAAGAIEYLPMTIVGGLPAAMKHASDKGIWIVGLDADGDTTLYDLALTDEPVMLVLGAEGKGLSRLVRQRCDTIAAIPLGGSLGSLNVAAAGALACFEVTRRRHQAK